MKRLQIYIEEDLDQALEQRARAEKTSKAALIRRYVRERVQPLPRLSEDPLSEMIGVDEYEPEDVDEVVYG